MLVRNLLVPVMLSTLLAGLAAGVLVWRTSLARREVLGATLQNQLGVFLQSSERLLLGTAALADRPDALSFLKESAPQFETIYRTDAAGRLVDVQPAQAGYLGMDFSNQLFMEVPVQEGRVSYTPAATSPLSGRQTVYLVTVIEGGGRLSAELRLGDLDAFLLQDADSKERATGVLLLDGSGNLLARGGKRLPAFGEVPNVGESRVRPGFSQLSTGRCHRLDDADRLAIAGRLGGLPSRNAGGAVAGAGAVGLVDAPLRSQLGALNDPAVDFAQPAGATNFPGRLFHLGLI
jgi:hypothetical protein